MQKNKLKERDLKMRKIFKKIVTVVAAAAMMVGTIAGMPTTEAKATTSTNVVVVLPESADGYDVYLQIDPNATNGTVTCTSATADPIAWGQMYTTAKEGRKYTATFNGEFGAGDYTSIGIVLVKNNSATGGYKYYPHDDRVLFNNNGTVYVAIPDVANGVDDKTQPGAWATLTATATDPTAITASEVKAKIAAIGTVEYTSESLAKINEAEAAAASYSGATTDISNYTTLTAARARYKELEAAANAAAAGKLTIYVTSEDGWSEMNVYGWDGADFGAWPGKKTTACVKNAGWFSLSFDITKATNLIFNNNDSSQTVDLTNIAAGTYWVTVKASEGGKCEAKFSTTAPAGWVDEAAADIETGGNTAPEGPTTVPTTVPTTADTTPVVAVVVAMAVLGLAVVAMNAKKVNR